MRHLFHPEVLRKKWKWGQGNQHSPVLLVWEPELQHSPGGGLLAVPPAPGRGKAAVLVGEPKWFAPGSLLLASIVTSSTSPTRELEVLIAVSEILLA